jgi:hypothetical protein
MTRTVGKTLVAVAALMLLSGTVPRLALAQVTDDNVVQQLQFRQDSRRPPGARRLLQCEGVGSSSQCGKA